MDLESISKSYFSNLNALAEKIASDIENTREAYQDLWHTLSKKEQNQTIDESIINPSAVLKYANLPSLRRIEQNYNVYSWFTRSQLNLNLGDMSYMNSGANVFCRGDADQSLKLTPTEKEEPKSNLTGQFSNKNPGSLENADDKLLKKFQKSSVLKPKNPPPPPPKVPAMVMHQDIVIEEGETKSNDIPKTGFDFLDNWMDHRKMLRKFESYQNTKREVFVRRVKRKLEFKLRTLSRI